jgi:hypothetical protein
MMAAEMAVIRLTHVADLPDPETLLRHLRNVQPSVAVAGGAPAGGGVTHGPLMRLAPSAPMRGPIMQGGQALAVQASPDALYQTFDQVVALIHEKRDMTLLFEVEATLRLVHYAPGRIEFEPTPNAAPDLAARLAAARTQLEAVQQRAKLANESRGFFDKSFRLGQTDLPTRLRIEAEAAEATRQAARSKIDLASAMSAWRQSLGLLPE